jgi:xyloglucan-specific exo-beta-1,4-glucanase
MMKKLHLVILLLFFATAPVAAQLSVVGSNEYGRIFDIVYDQNTPGKLYAATMGNHIVASENNGDSWELLYTYPQAGVVIKDLKQMPENKLAFTINNPNEYYNSGIYILDVASLNIVQTFETPVPLAATSSYISAYDIYSANPDIAIVQQYYEEGFTLKAKVYYTTNGGSLWTEIYDNTENEFIFPANVAIRPDNPQKLFMARMGGLDPEHIGGFLISENAGATWEEKLPGIDFKPIAFNPQDPETILIGTTVGSQTQDMFQSIDGGETWNAVDENWAESVTGAIITIKYNPVNADNIIILAEKDIITTSDGLETLQFYHHESGIHNPEGNTNYYYGTNASFNPFAAGEIFISANYFPLFTSDGGATVTRAKQPYFSSLEFTSYVSIGNQSHLYYGVQNGFVHKDLNTLTETPAFVRSLASFSNFSTEFFADQLVSGRTYMFVSSFNSAGLNISNDHGLTYMSVPVSGQYMNAVMSQPGNPNLIWYSASDFSGVSSLYQLNISDASNLQPSPVALPEGNLLTAMYFNPVNAEEKWIALGPNIYKSLTGGNWELSSEGLESLENGVDRIFQIVRNPLVENEMALATTKGIFISLDGGTTWAHSDAFPVNGVHLIGYSPVSAGQMVAVTYDSEFTSITIRYSADGGQSWEEVPAENLAHIASYSAALQFGIDSATVYISTTDLGLISHTIDFTQLSIPEISETNSFAKVYPNPSNDYISLQLQNESLSSAVIFSVTGQKVMEGNDTKIDISSFESGIYFVKINTVSGKTTTQKMIKQ